MRAICLILLIAASGCVNLTQEHKTVAKRPSFIPRPVTADQITAENAEKMSLRLWEEMKQDTLKTPSTKASAE